MIGVLLFCWVFFLIAGSSQHPVLDNIVLCRRFFEMGMRKFTRVAALNSHVWCKRKVNPFTPKSDQCQNSPAASQEIWHHTVWRTWLFIAYSDEKWLYYKFSLHHSHNRFLKGWENTLFELRSERVKGTFGSPSAPLRRMSVSHAFWRCRAARKQLTQ